MPAPVQRKPLARSKDHILDLDLPPGDWIVWWYSAYQYNRDSAAPWVKVVFRRLEDNHLSEFETRQISISTLGLYQPGYILENNQMSSRAEVVVEDFKINYKDYKLNSRSYAESKNIPAPFSDRDYELPSECNKDWVIELPIDGGKLIINCTEFLVRGYSRRPEIPRILSTYEWSEAERRLFARININYTDWTIFPHRDIVNEDTYLLAHIQCDLSTKEACKYIFNQLDNDEFSSGAPHHIQVKPWFFGMGTLTCRGYRVNNGKDFLCTELIGMSLPEGKPFETIRLKKEKDENALEDTINLQELHRSEPASLESLPLTNKHDPRRSGQRETIEHGEFRIKFPDRHVRRTFEITNYSKQRIIIKDRQAAEQFSPNEGNGRGDTLTGRVFISTMETPERTGGTLINMWHAFQHLKKQGHIKSVDWFVPDNTFDDSLPLTCIEIEGNGLPWAEMGGGRQRRLLLLRIRTAEKTVLVAELERGLNPVSGSDAQSEDTISGMVCVVKHLQQACIMAKAISEHIASHRGNFKKLRKIQGLPEFAVFRHNKNTANTVPLESTAINALILAGIDIPRLRPIKHDQKKQ